MATHYRDRLITFVVAVNDSDELRHNLLASAVADNPKHQWLLVANHNNKRYRNMGQLYSEAIADAKHDLVFFIHQDVYLMPAWEAQMCASLQHLEATDPDWGVIGAVGAVPAPDGMHRTLVGHWRDPHQYHRSRNLPREVQSLDHLWIGLRKQQGLRFDPELPGFHCQGVDICLSARTRGFKCYVLDAFVWHKYRDANGRRILNYTDSPKIRRRETQSFHQEYTAAAEYIRRKWHHIIPFHSTSDSWC